MAIKVSPIIRVFQYDDEILTDPNPAMSPEEVISFYSAEYPEFVSAIHETVFEEDKIVYEIKTNIGTKG